MEKIVVETLCADLAAEGDCPGAAWNALWEWLTDVAAPAAAAEEAILAPVESQSAACASAFPALVVVIAALMAALVALGIAVYWLRNSRRALRRALYTDCLLYTSSGIGRLPVWITRASWTTSACWMIWARKRSCAAR